METEMMVQYLRAEAQRAERLAEGCLRMATERNNQTALRMHYRMLGKASAFRQALEYVKRNGAPAPEPMPLDMPL